MPKISIDVNKEHKKSNNIARENDSFTKTFEKYMYEQTPNQTHTHTYIDYIRTYTHTHTYNRGSKQLKATYPYKLQTSKHSYSFI